MQNENSRVIPRIVEVDFGAAHGHGRFACNLRSDFDRFRCGEPINYQTSSNNASQRIYSPTTSFKLPLTTLLTNPKLIASSAPKALAVYASSLASE
jgi:hypothetical protein